MLLRSGSREGFSAVRAWRGFRRCELGQCHLDLVVFVCVQRLVAVPRLSRFYRFSPFKVLFTKIAGFGWLVCHVVTSCRYPGTVEVLKGPQPLSEEPKAAFGAAGRVTQGHL